MLRGVQVIQDDKAPVAQRADLIPRLARVTPHLELIVVAASLVQVLPLIKAQLLLPVVAAVVPAEEQLVVRADRGEALRVVVGRAPNLRHNVLRERVQQQLDEVVVVDHVEGVTAVQVLLEQQKAHLLLRGHRRLVLDGDFKDAVLRLLHSPVHKGKASLHFDEQLDD